MVISVYHLVVLLYSVYFIAPVKSWTFATEPCNEKNEIFISTDESLYSHVCDNVI